KNIRYTSPSRCSASGFAAWLRSFGCRTCASCRSPSFRHVIASDLPVLRGGANGPIKPFVQAHTLTRRRLRGQLLRLRRDALELAVGASPRGAAAPALVQNVDVHARPAW